MTNEGWPEAFGFSVTGDAPVLISDVEEGGSAQQAGLQIGDVIIELDAENVEKWSRDQVIERARFAVKVPPSLIVMSRVRQFVIQRTKDGGCGFTVRGNSPVFVRSVDFHTSARVAGLRSGDLLLEINGQNVRYATKMEVLDLLKRSGYVLQVMVVAGGLWATPRPSAQARTRQHHITRETVEKRHNKAKVFQNKVNYYLLDDPMKKTHLYTLLRLYTKNRNVDGLATSLDILLDSPIERRLFADIKNFIHPSDVAKFDTHLSYGLGSGNGHRRSVDLESLDEPHPLRASDRGSPWRSSLPNLTQEGERFVPVYRGNGGFGFILSGNAPVFIRSVDRGGAAAMAGLRAGDRLLQLNGLNIRNATHSHVVRLLRGSGTRPTLVVSSASLGMTTPPTAGGRRASATNVAGSHLQLGNASSKKHSQEFREKMEQVLLDDERQHVIRQLKRFSQTRDIPELIGDLGDVLNEPNKAMLFHYICQLIPHEAQAEFDRIAAASLAGEPISTTVKEGLKFTGAPGNGGASMKGLASSNMGGAGIGTAGGMGVGGAGTDAGGLVLQDTPIRGVGVANTSLDRGASSIKPATKPSGGQSLDEQLSAAISGRGKQLPSTPTGVVGAAAADVSSLSTPGVPMPPNPPPTPQGGIPVPPPPPPTIPGGAQSSRSNLKRVNWEKIHGTEGTIWRELSGLEEALEYYEIEEKFSRQKPKDAVQEKSKKTTTILEPRKAYNISILLGHLKMPFSKIKEAVLSCDENVLSEQHLRQMESFAPDDKECLGFARHYDNPGVLSIADQFSCEMSTIPCYRERLKAMIFKLHFKEKVEEIKPDLEAISLASVQLQTSKLFRKVLEVILAVGNYMNAGNIRVGGAIGFRISFLTQLKTLRTTDNKSSLLHFVANVVERKFPHVLEFPDDLSFAIKAARVSGETLEVEVSELTQGLNDIRTDVKELGSREQLQGDRFAEIMTEFVSEAESEMKSLLRLYGHMKQEYTKVVKFFGEDTTKMRIDEFFSAFASFIEDFKKAVEDNKAAREKELEIEKRQQEKEHPMKKTKSNKQAHWKERKAEDFRKELKQRSQGINVALLEDRLGSKSAVNPSPQQQDFRHILRPSRQTDNARPRLDTDTPAMATPGGRIATGDQEHQWQRGVMVPEHQLGRANAPGEHHLGEGQFYHQSEHTATALGGQSGYNYHPPVRGGVVGQTRTAGAASQRLQHSHVHDINDDFETLF